MVPMALLQVREADTKAEWKQMITPSPTAPGTTQPVWGSLGNSNTHRLQVGSSPRGIEHPQC